MKKFKNFEDLNVDDRINVENELFSLLDDSRAAWADKEEFYGLNADAFKPYIVNEAYGEEGDSLGECIILSNRIAVENNSENWAAFSGLFDEQLLKVKQANEE